jgi:hypothetical protein
MTTTYVVKRTSFGETYQRGDWFSWLLICAVYPAFLTLFAKLQYRN